MMLKAKKTTPKLPVFQTFKTKGKEFTGEAMRQQGIITHLITETLPTRRTRTAIAHRLAEKNNRFSETSMRYSFHLELLKREEGFQ
ncbi:MAG: hypothetical protein E6K98_00280 [Thaumarchaeota archaeon]|nr:MAG: hypothetical protein E6K98_00280 [Nitrososphaerota archaeon]